MVRSNAYDVIVIGGGSAGCAAASRLSEDPSRRVLLLEAGPDPQPLPRIIADGSGGNVAVLESDFVIMYPTERKADGSEYYPISGRIIGGGSSVNMMGASWPSQFDLNGWAARGNPGWTYEECLPVLRRLENDLDFGDRPNHGNEGLVTVQRSMAIGDDQGMPMQAIIDHAAELGFPLQDDGNGPSRFGIAPSAWNVKDNLRQSSSVAYLGVARGRQNLTVIGDAPVVGLTVQGSRVTEVRYERDGQIHTASADRFLLSSGTYHSPQILMLSGIGPVDELERHGIPVVHELPGVGRNYMDHASVNMAFEGAPGVTANWAGLYARFNLSYKSSENRPEGNLHIIPRAPIQVEGLKPLLPVMINLMEQTNRGRLTLASTDPHELPVIDDGMLQDPRDVESMLTAMRFVGDFFHGGGLEDYYGPLAQPGPGEDWQEFAQTTYDSHHHGSGTCMMGPSSDPMAVVDHTLKMHGMDNLWVADASIFPVVPHAATNFSALMVGERASDFIRAV